ncbi:MAG: hypothetical protein IJ100_02690 [Lachnospiraceae bacterium]|nr:hypothetical protein [Lachnospiraceae bacterium]
MEQCGRGEAVDTDALLAQFKSEDKGEGRHGHRHDHSHGGEKHRRH